MTGVNTWQGHNASTAFVQLRHQRENPSCVTLLFLLLWEMTEFTWSSLPLPIHLCKTGAEKTLLNRAQCHSAVWWSSKQPEDPFCFIPFFVLRYGLGWEHFGFCWPKTNYECQSCAKKSQFCCRENWSMNAKKYPKVNWSLMWNFGLCLWSEWGWGWVVVVDCKKKQRWN